MPTTNNEGSWTANTRQPETWRGAPGEFEIRRDNPGVREHRQIW
jgi:hypothetical protein